MMDKMKDDMSKTYDKIQARDENEESERNPSEKTEIARNWLKKAIKLHEAHMNGKVPTTGIEGEKSQQKIMDQMSKALNALD